MPHPVPCAPALFSEGIHIRWFKHFSRAHRDTKIKRIINEFGAEGYAVYFYCLELAADALESDNITFEIEDDAELIAQYLKMDSVKTARIMQRCVDFELLSIADSGRIAALKMAKFLDERFTRNDALKALIKSEKMADVKGLLSSDINKTFGDNSVNIRRDEMRQDKTREEKEARPRFVPPSIQEVEAHLKEKGITEFTAERFCMFYESNGWKVGRNPMRNWKAAVVTWVGRHSVEKKPDKDTASAAWLIVADCAARGKSPTDQVLARGVKETMGHINAYGMCQSEFDRSVMQKKFIDWYSRNSKNA